MTKIKKINKNYYRIFAEPICGVFLDEHLMKKANKILYKYQNEIEQLLENNKEHIIKHEWSLAYPHGKQESFFGHDGKPVERVVTPQFITKKVENLYDIGDKDIYSDEVKEEVEKLLELE